MRSGKTEREKRERERGKETTCRVGDELDCKRDLQLELHIQQIIIHLHVLTKQFCVGFVVVGVHPRKLAASLIAGDSP